MPEELNMAEMGRYCRAYYCGQFRTFSSWSENKENIKKETREVDGKCVEIARELEEDSILYLQENYVVTHGIFVDEHIIFDQVTDEWREFCTNTLNFKIPDSEED